MKTLPPALCFTFSSLDNHVFPLSLNPFIGFLLPSAWSSGFPGQILWWYKLPLYISWEFGPLLSWLWPCLHLSLPTAHNLPETPTVIFLLYPFPSRLHAFHATVYAWNILLLYMFQIISDSSFKSLHKTHFYEATESDLLQIAPPDQICSFIHCIVHIWSQLSIQFWKQSLQGGHSFSLYICTTPGTLLVSVNNREYQISEKKSPWKSSIKEQYYFL